MYKQIPLHFELHDTCVFDSFVTGDNELLIDLLRKSASGDAEKQVFLWGEAGSGRTHLLQAACGQAANQGRTSCYLPAQSIIEHGVDCLEGLESIDLVCMDDVDELVAVDAGNNDWHEGLFHLINRCRESGCVLVMSASSAPENIQTRLDDLRSRLSWGPVLRLVTLSDDDKREALMQRAHNRGIELPVNVAEYLLRHYPRDLFGLFERLDQLDQASLSAKRKLTIPFVKSVLSA